MTTTTILRNENSHNTLPTASSEHGPVGCYLVFEPSSGGRLLLQYSKGLVPDNAVGFWAPSSTQQIQTFKFAQAGGRVELIKGIAGGDANRKKYYVGWCLFLKACKAKQGSVIQFTPLQGVEVDIYGYIQAHHQPVLLDFTKGMISLEAYDAVAVMPKHHEFLAGVKSIAVSNFLEGGNIAGASTILSG